MKKNMIEEVKLEKLSDTYSLWHIRNLALDHLAIFLTEAVREGNELDYFNDPSIMNLCYNEPCVYRDSESDDHFIISSENFSEVIPDFRIKKDLLQRIVDSWIQVYKQYPEMIYLTQQDNKFTFEFDTKDGHQKVVVD